MSSRKTTGITFDLVQVAMTAIGNQRTTCFPQIAHYTPACVAAHRRTAVGNQRTTCFPQIAHYTPAFVAAHRRRSLFTPAVRSSSKSQNWITHRPAALCSCHSLNPLHASVLNKGQVQVQISRFLRRNSSSRTRSNYYIDIVTSSRMNCRVTTVEGLPSSTGVNSS